MRFKDVPIFYTPYLAFPLGDERKSGLLFPSFGHSGNNGYQLEVPYYFNLAPNYDLTLTPGYLSARGVQLGGEFRFLTASSHGQIEENFLPNDTIQHSDRAYIHITDITNLTQGLRFDTDIASVSDSNYFERFRGGRGSNQRHLSRAPRRAPVLRRCVAHPRSAAELPDHRYLDRCRRPALFTRAARRGLRPVAAVQQPVRIRARQRGHQFPARGRSRRRARRICRRSCAGRSRERRLFLRARRRLSLHPIRFAECRLRRSEHADPHPALCGASTPV